MLLYQIHSRYSTLRGWINAMFWGMVFFIVTFFYLGTEMAETSAVNDLGVKVAFCISLTASIPIGGIVGMFASGSNFDLTEDQMLGGISQMKASVAVVAVTFILILGFLFNVIFLS